VILNGLRYHVEVHGTGEPLLLLHGFTGSARSWDGIADALGRRTIAVDLPGHGRTEIASDVSRYRMEQVVADLAALLDALNIARTAVLGYSMGGRVALHLALAAPERMGRLILESSSPGIAGETERAARRAADEALARRLDEEGLERFIDRWNDLPLFGRGRLDVSRRDELRRQQLAGSAEGLAASLRGMGAGVPGALWDKLSGLGETLIVAGELDDKYVEIGRRMQSLMPKAQLVVVPGAGHTVHLEQPGIFCEVVREYLNDRGVRATQASRRPAVVGSES